MALSYAMVPFTCAEANVSWRPCLDRYMNVPFTCTAPFTLGSGSKLRDCEYIYIIILG